MFDDTRLVKIRSKDINAIEETEEGSKVYVNGKCFDVLNTYQGLVKEICV